MLTAGRLRELLDYNPATGVFRWKVWRQGVRESLIAGTPHAKGYLTITIDQRGYRAHRLAWLYVYGRWPKGNLDHKNNERAANQIKNLREATLEQNQRNSKRRKHNKSGFKGVSRMRRKWLARITVEKKTVRLGLFDTPEAAHRAYRKALRKQAGEFARFQ